MSPEDCCVLNSGSGAWAFEPLALQLSRSLGVDVSDKPRRFNYLLHLENGDEAVGQQLFIPLPAILLASDKRLLAEVFLEHHVPIPETRLLNAYEQVQQFVQANSGREWCLKFPTSCGASGHRLVHDGDDEPPNWPRPFVVQEFIRLERPEVYRTYCAAGELFGWVARRFPEGSEPSRG